MDPSNLTKNPTTSISNAIPPSVNSISKLTNGTSNLAPTQKASKPAAAPSTPIVPRLEVQPYHESLKGALTKEDWMVYTESLNKFLRGRLSDEELIEEIGRFIKGPKVRLHNNLLSVLISNMTRDTPAAEVAGWVSASDKPSSGSKLPVGDLNERKLKKEVMAISARERRRIKEVQEKPEHLEDMLGNMLQEYHMVKQVKPPEPPPRSAGLNKTNWESEIKQRYTLPLSSESGEFPDIDNIRLRMLPICYEEGIPGGCTHDTASFMNVAAETFVKEVLSSIISRVRSNTPQYVQTEKYKKLTAKNRWVAQERPLLGMHDMRLSLTLGDNFLTQMPLSMKKIMAGGWYERDYEVDPELQFRDEPDAGAWEGGDPDSRRELKGLLDDVLSLGS